MEATLPKLSINPIFLTPYQCGSAMPCTQTINKCMMMSVVTITGRMNTWMKYIRVTVSGVNSEPENNNVATYFPTSGLEFAKLIPMIAAPYARLSQGKRYPEYPNTMVRAIKATPMSQLSSRVLRYAPVKYTRHMCKKTLATIKWVVQW